MSEVGRSSLSGGGGTVRTSIQTGWPAGNPSGGGNRENSRKSERWRKHSGTKDPKVSDEQDRSPPTPGSPPPAEPHLPPGSLLSPPPPFGLPAGRSAWILLLSVSPPPLRLEHPTSDIVCWE
ncbi:hypothetical protein JZ751_013745 [Albula glossodonta]|uniref:Uncharacterized protein n=1 Tax=Albula glossodonta TaxID=121402 RepID=A0A8T2NT88_9TELE|nr:hypothetical protein JZ751_013745 [Albula glossodonta]